ncbi:helix-turn-helix domain-containing protein [Nocardia africana]|uniref:Anaerobic benzoate catabolism transcriptional regulator n=2 Tax=Nocardia africana TaxID=134964 RepID=A0A378X5R2_9NOCA|nr:helix-turn-helix transcriptional regulator [Nocardia africana]SUA47883.1 anaerobic benzoate catabolism transcriptional regulator [Nocardia africana]
MGVGKKYDDSGIPPNDLGRRLREIRAWRGLSLEAAAGLAGISYGYLGKLERGEKSLENRRTLEAIAAALRVAPSEFTGRPWEVTEGPSAEAYGGIADAEQALDACELGEDPGVATRQWPAVAADLAKLEERRGAGDYQSIARMAPPLLLELHALYVRRPEYREPILCGIIGALFAVMVMTKRFGARGLPLLAGKAAQATADELDLPEWRGAAMWMRNNVSGSLSRPQHYARAVATADQLTSSLNDETVLQSYGMLHLSAALAAAVQSDRTTAATHLDEAAAVAERMDSDVGSFGRMWFGRTNVAVWRASVGMELGDGPKALEAISGIGIEAIPDRARLAGFYSEAGRVMLAEAKTRDSGVATLLKAEQLAPQRIRSDLFVREAIADQLRAARRDAGGRELRGLAWRIGIAPDSGETRR